MRDLNLLEVVAELAHERAYLKAERIADTDVRLQVEAEWDEDAFECVSWHLHVGDAGYDTDHRGFWGSASLDASASEADLVAIAQDLIAQACDSAAQSPLGDI